MKKEICLILYNIRSAHNVGSIFRTADAASVSHVYLTGYTPSPIDRFNRERKDISKVALGAEKTVPWTHTENIEEVISELKKKGFTIIALEQDKKSVDYKTIRISQKSLLILGEEVNGIPKSILKKCDIIAEIPMRGKKESLNVSVAAGIALFRIYNL